MLVNSVGSQYANPEREVFLFPDENIDGAKTEKDTGGYHVTERTSEKVEVLSSWFGVEVCTVGLHIEQMLTEAITKSSDSFTDVDVLSMSACNSI